MKSYRIASIPGDGIGIEVIAEGIRVLDALAALEGFSLKFKAFDWSSARFKSTGAYIPAGGLAELKTVDAIFFGAVGAPDVPDHVSLWGLLIPIRRGFDQYINLRPVRLFKGLKCPLADRKPGDIDYWIVRENTEGEYSAIGGRMAEGTEYEAAVQQAIFTRRGSLRVAISQSPSVYRCLNHFRHRTNRRKETSPVHCCRGSSIAAALLLAAIRLLCRLGFFRLLLVILEEHHAIANRQRRQLNVEARFAILHRKGPGATYPCEVVPLSFPFTCRVNLMGRLFGVSVCH